MTQLEKLQTGTLREVAEFLDEKCWNDSAPWTVWFNRRYCHDCPVIKAKVIELDRYSDFSYCELEDTCRYFDHILTGVEMCEEWLKTEVDN